MAENIAPGDIHAESGFRLPLPDPATLDGKALAMYERFMDPHSDTYAGIHGPGGVRLHSPKLAVATQEVGTYLRREAGITPREREVAVLSTARELDSQFEWAAHEEPARKAGAPEAVIEAIRHRRPLDGLPEEDAVIIALAREAFGERKVSKGTYARAHGRFGTRKLIDLVGLMGNYAATALILTVFDMQLHPGQTPGLPPR